MEALGSAPTTGWYAGTFLYCLAAGVVPILNSEAYLLWMGVSAPRQELPLLLATACVAQMLGKSILFAAGRGLVRLPMGRNLEKLEAIKRLMGPQRSQGWFVFASALTGLPPFYWFSLGAGALRWRFGSFFAAGLAGRAVRFAVFALAPQGFEVVR